MIDIYNQSLEKFDDGKRHMFTATFDRLNDRLAIFTALRVGGPNNPVQVKRIALHYVKTFKVLHLIKGDVVTFEGSVNKDSNNEFMVQRPSKAKKVKAADPSKNKVHEVGDNWNWFEN